MKASKNRTDGESDTLDFLFILGKLKSIPRTGWTRYPIPGPESVADHSFRAAAMALFLAPKYGADPDRTTKMLLIHDIGEAVIGDVITNRWDKDLPNMEQKLIAEREALASILRRVDAEEYLELFDEFTANETAEAKLANQLDKLEMALQAREYELEHGVDLGEFYVTAKKRISDPQIVELLSKISEYGEPSDH